MKVLTILCSLLLGFNSLSAQNHTDYPPVIPEKSTLFANDIYIDNEPDQNQRTLAICSAFNGWLFAAMGYTKGTRRHLSLFKSTDFGKHWASIFDNADGWPGDYYKKIDIIAVGQDTSNLKLFVAACDYDHSLDITTNFVSRFNCAANYFEEEILMEYSWFMRDISLASDAMFPASNSNPNSIAVLFSITRNSWSQQDSLIFRSSSNGGQSFDNRTVVAVSSNYYNNVSLSYGRSSTFNEGRYFAAWEEKANASSPTGHIYTAHTEPNFNSPFTSPQLIDIDPSLNNKVRNPVIACQYGNTDNENGNLSEVILCEKYNSAANKSDIIGLYNTNAVTTNNFNSFSLTSGSHNYLQPDICFNPFDSTFMVTYFNSTFQRLPYLTQNYNLSSPDSWNVVSSGYNDLTNLTAPYPKVRLAYGKQTGSNVWIADSTNGFGMAMFDAPFNFPVGVHNFNSKAGSLSLHVYPNPITTNAVIDFQLENNSDVEIIIVNALGQVIDHKTLVACNNGHNRMRVDFSKYIPGSYIIRLTSKDYTESKKILIE